MNMRIGPLSAVRRQLQRAMIYGLLTAPLLFIGLPVQCLATDISITAANVLAGAGAVTQSGTAGAAITAGQLVYLDATTNTIKLCHASTSLATATCVGVALNGASTSQPVTYQTSGDITIGGTLVTGSFYITSANNAGGLAPVADLSSGWYPIIFGISKSTTVLTIINRGASVLTAH
jgi:hypothetical protein